MTALQEMGGQPLTLDSLVQIMLKSTDGWDQVATFAALTMLSKIRKMEIGWERHKQPIAAATQHPIPDFSSPLFAISNPALEGEEDDPGW